MSDTTFLTRDRPSLMVRALRPVAKAWLRVVNLRVTGDMPRLKKFVIVAAPHKTNWDLPNALAAGLHYGIRINWMGKDSLFRWPFAGFMRWLGGVPVDRSKRNNAVDAMAEALKAADEMVLVIPPEGTRSDVDRWKSGFYYIALGAGVPLVLAFIDYTKREVGVRGVFYPTGDYEADLQKIQAVYAEITPYKPSRAAA